MTHVYVAHLRRGSKIRCVSGQSMTVHKGMRELVGECHSFPVIASTKEQANLARTTRGRQI